MSISFSLQPYYISQFSKSMTFATSSTVVDINLATATYSTPCLYEFFIKVPGQVYCGKEYALYSGSSSIWIPTAGAETGLAISRPTTSVMRIDAGTGSTSIAFSVNQTFQNVNRTQISTSATSPYTLNSFDISVFNKSILTASGSNAYVFINMSSIIGTGNEYLYEVTAASIAGGFRYGCALVNVSSSGAVNVVTQFTSGSIAFTDDSTLLLRIYVALSGIPVYVSFNRVFNLNNALSGGPATTANTYNYNSNYFENIDVQGVRFTTDTVDKDVFVKFVSTTESKMNIPTGNDFFLYKCLASVASTNVSTSVFYVLVSAWSFGIHQVVRTTNEDINVTLYTPNPFTVQIATNFSDQNVFCSFQRMIDTTNTILIPV